jgi:hypothetical protein
MPIRINLLSEELAEEELRKRDPVKRAIFVGIFLVAVMLAWFSSTWLEYKLSEKNYNLVVVETESHTNDFSRVQADLKKISDAQKRLDTLQKVSSDRFLQGNFLNALQQVYVPGVQLTRVHIEQSFSYKDGLPDKTNDLGVVSRGRPGMTTQAISFLLEAKDSSANPGDQVNNYKDALAKLPYFKTRLNPTNGITLASLSSPQLSASGKPFVFFSLECRFTDTTK